MKLRGLNVPPLGCGVSSNLLPAAEVEAEAALETDALELHLWRVLRAEAGVLGSASSSCARTMREKKARNMSLTPAPEYADVSKHEKPRRSAHMRASSSSTCAHAELIFNKDLLGVIAFASCLII